MMRVLMLVILMAMRPLTGAGAEPPAPVPAAVLPREQIEQALRVLENPAERARVIATLRALEAAGPAAAYAAPVAIPLAPAPLAAPPLAATPLAAVPTPGVAPSAAGTPPAAATPPGAAPPAASLHAGPLPIPLAPHSLGAAVVRTLSQRIADTLDSLTASVVAFVELPVIWEFSREIAADPSARAHILHVALRVLVIAAAGLALEALTARALRRARAALAARAPGTALDEQAEEAPAPDNAGLAAAEAGAIEAEPLTALPRMMLRRLPFALVNLVLELAPLAVFAAVAYGILTARDYGYTTRLAILTVVNAYVAARAVMALTRMLVAPASPRLRLVAVSDALAGETQRWVRRAALTGIPGYALAEILLLFGMPYAAHDLLLKLVVLVLHLYLVAIVLRARRRISALIAGPVEAHGPFALLRRRLAGSWHLFAVFYILALWLVWAFAVTDGYMRLLRIFVAAGVVLIGMRVLNALVLGAIERRFRLRDDVAAQAPWLAARMRHYLGPVRWLVSATITVVALIALLEVWGVDALGWFGSDGLGARLVSALTTIGFVLAGSLLVWETVNIAIQRRLHLLSLHGNAPRAARIRTLLPMIRAALLVVLLLFGGPLALSEIGLNIAPLLAGAGIVGVAVGFGSQKLVQDFITGIFLLIENAMQVGDWVTVAGVSGTVEALSIRTIRLRDTDGSVHIIPFSAVTTVNNTNRGLGNAPVHVVVSAREDPDRVGEALRDIVREMRHDPRFQRGILGELQLWGVDKVEGSSVTIAGQIICTDTARWSVQREFNRRMKKRFDELGFQLMNPVQTVLVQGLETAAAPARATEARPEAAQ